MYLRKSVTVLKVKFEISNVNKKYLTYYNMDSKVPKGVSHDILKRDIPTQNVARTNGVLDIKLVYLDQ